jgi:hypothetical protein
MAKTVLALGLDPVHADFSQMPNLTPELVRAFIGAQLDRVRALGYTVESCLVDAGETAGSVARARLSAQEFDCVMFGAGLRAAPQLLLFERLINLVHELAPGSKICFNSTPADTAEAVQRCIGAPA